jgi:hypothetical protein
MSDDEARMVAAVDELGDALARWFQAVMERQRAGLLEPHEQELFAAALKWAALKMAAA